jgi:CRISPR-associated endoribonuclease Cas6
LRIKISLKAIFNDTSLPVNYQYFLTGLIYRFIGNSSEDYSRFLHDEGYRIGESKNGFKLFCYSMLMSKNAKVRGDRITFRPGNIEWYITSPVPDFIRHLVSGVFAEGQEIKIGPDSTPSRFMIIQVETLSDPQFTNTMHLTCLSPITVSVNDADRSKPHYMRPWEEGLADAIKNNLLKKYFLVHGKNLDNAGLLVALDSDYMNKRAGKIIKNIRFKGTNIIGFLAPFTVTGNTELLQIGYEAGFGEKGSMGFGMVKARV